MRNWIIVAAVLCIAPVAGAQDAPKEAPKEEPAPRHVNRISAAAQAAFDKFAALAYSPLKLGLKDLSGAVKMEMEAGPAGEGMKSRAGAMGKMDLVFAVVFKAPSDLKVELVDAPGKEEADKAGKGMGARMMKGMGEGMGVAVKRILHSTLEGYVPASDTEFDADVRVDNGVSTILITTYLKGVEVSREEMTLDVNGLPSVMITTPKAGAAAPAPGPGPGGRGRAMGTADGKSTVKFAYAKEGDLFRLEKMTMDGTGGVMEAKLDYADAGNFKVVRSWEVAPASGPFKFGFKFSEMIVNGKVVNLPAEAPATETKPEGKDAPKPGEGMGGDKGGKKDE